MILANTNDRPNGNTQITAAIWGKTYFATPWVKIIFTNSERNRHERRTLASNQSRQYRFDIA
jgi:hypothetical protein